MELATILGLIVAFGSIIGAILIDGGDLFSLFNVPSLVMVLGGTIGAAMMGYPLKTFLTLPILIKNTFIADSGGPTEIITQFVSLADQARREGLLSLEETVNKLEEPLVKKGLMLVVDGVDPEVVRNVLEIDNDLAARRHGAGIALMETMASLGPAMGLLGTVVGLIGVLRNLSDPSSLGPSMAVAFLTTLYGVIVANLIFIPLATKLKQKDKTESIVREVTVEGVLAIQAGENPRIVREKLESFLLPKLRGQESTNKEG
ncbi:MAG TPA: motility protein A [Anaerolineae bacterium]|nr:motility protein A [Anaerolineae bacterium]HMR65409.1 motility protein A [Anaerolineae bacterium]